MLIVQLKKIFYIINLIKVNNIIIFVGGKGTRLGNITKRTPKPLIIFNNIEFLYYQINLLSKLFPKKIILLCGYKKEQFKRKFHNKVYKGIKINCVFEKKLLGTGGSLENAKKYIVNNTLICNGDTYFNYNFKKLNNIKFNKIVLLLIKNKIYKSNKKLSKLSLNRKKVIFSKNSSFMNSGFYLVNKKFKSYLKKGKFSFENDILEDLINNRIVDGKKVSGIHIDIGIKKNLHLFDKYSKKFIL